jgi:hypothetical protein
MYQKGFHSDSLVLKQPCVSIVIECAQFYVHYIVLMGNMSNILLSCRSDHLEYKIYEPIWQ